MRRKTTSARADARRRIRAPRSRYPVTGQAAVKLEIPALLGLTQEACEAEIIPNLRDLRRSPKTP